MPIASNIRNGLGGGSDTLECPGAEDTHGRQSLAPPALQLMSLCTHKLHTDRHRYPDRENSTHVRLNGATLGTRVTNLSRQIFVVKKSQ
jgi:hypothetical protein